MPQQRLSDDEIKALLWCATNKSGKARPWTDKDLRIAGKLIGKRFMQPVKSGTSDNIEGLIQFVLGKD